MKKTPFRILLAFLLIGCSGSDSVQVDNRLEEKIHLIIESYQKKVADPDNLSLDPPIYEVHFMKREDQCFVVINTDYFYRTDLDGYKFIKNKLVTFYIEDSVCNEDLVKISDKEQEMNLEDYISEEEAFDNYSPAWWVFQLRDNKLVATKQGRHKINFE
jgi:hypothetical protein